MEQEQKPEQLAAIQDALAKLAESHGLTVKELIDIAKTPEQKPEEPKTTGMYDKKFGDLARLGAMIQVSDLGAAMQGHHDRDYYVNAEKRNELLREFGMIEPPTEDAARQLILQLDDRASQLRAADRLLAERTDLRSGAAVHVRRSNGAIQDGWQIENFYDDGSVQVINSADGLQKSISVETLAEVNPPL